MREGPERSEPLSCFCRCEFNRRWRRSLRSMEVPSVLREYPGLFPHRSRSTDEREPAGATPRGIEPLDAHAPVSVARWQCYGHYLTLWGLTKAHMSGGRADVRARLRLPSRLRSERFFAEM